MDAQHLHRPGGPPRDGLALTHGAGSNANAPLLVALAERLAAAGVTVLRFDLPFRAARPHGPPFPAQAARDREGIREAAAALRASVPGRVFLGGHSYGGRQTTILASETPDLADGLLLLSYPLHPPKKPQDLRTAHLPNLRIPSLFIHGTRDAFGSEDEMRAALALIPERTELRTIPGARHDLGGPRHAATIAGWLRDYFAF